MAGFIIIVYSALYKNGGQVRVYVDTLAKCSNLVFRRCFLINPSLVHNANAGLRFIFP